jgi:hypothetical protein
MLYEDIQQRALRTCGEVIAMSKEGAAHGHLWNMRELRLGEETFFHQQCLRCRRDLVLRWNSSEWQAVHVCGFKFDYLDEQTSLRWRTDDCPGETLAGEANRERLFLKIANDKAA